jgi:hypothetical protein
MFWIIKNFAIKNFLVLWLKDICYFTETYLSYLSSDTKLDFSSKLYHIKKKSVFFNLLLKTAKLIFIYWQTYTCVKYIRMVNDSLFRRFLNFRNTMLCECMFCHKQYVSYPFHREVLTKLHLEKFTVICVNFVKTPQKNKTETTRKH